MDQLNTKNLGIALSATGLALGILALIGSPAVLFICTGWASFEEGMTNALALAIAWTLFSSIAVLLGIFGRKKSKVAGRKTGLGTAAMVIGLIAELASIGVICSVFMVESYS